MSRSLCICVDDFGLSEGINEAVVDLARRGRICATGLMVKRSACDDAVARLRDVPPGALAVGLHLDMGPLLDTNGGDGSLARLIAASYLDLLDRSRVEAEIGEQLSRFEDRTGRMPAFIDGHQHVHQLPVIRELLVEAIGQRYAARPPWLRLTAPPNETRLPRDKPGIVFALGGRALRSLAAQHRIPASRRLLGVYGFDGTQDEYRRRLDAWLQDCRSGDVLMCHPCADATDRSPHAAARRHEYALLRSLDLRELPLDIPIVLSADAGALLA